MLNNDRVSHWYLGAVLSWAAAFVLLGLPVFHFWLMVSIKKIAAFSVLACVLQIAFIPWLFSARATAQNPVGLRLKRTVAVIVWLSLLDLLFNYFALRDGSPDFGTKAIFLGGPLVLGTVILIIIGIISRIRRSNSGRQGRWSA
jgi:hypothetical protein